MRGSPNQTWNLRLGYRLHTRAELRCDVFDLLDAKVNDIQYHYASRLLSEAASVDDLHVHPEGDAVSGSYQRNTRGPSSAPASVAIAMPSTYQIPMKGTADSGQCSA